MLNRHLYSYTISKFPNITVDDKKNIKSDCVGGYKKNGLLKPLAYELALDKAMEVLELREPPKKRSQKVNFSSILIVLQSEGVDWKIDFIKETLIVSLYCCCQKSEPFQFLLKIV